MSDVKKLENVTFASYAPIKAGMNVVTSEITPISNEAAKIQNPVESVNLDSVPSALNVEDPNYPTDAYLENLKKEHSSNYSLSTVEIVFSSIGSTLITPITGVADLFQAAGGAITGNEWQSITKNMWGRVAQYSSVDVFVDFLKSTRDKMDTANLKYYMDQYEKGNYISTINNHIEFYDGVEIYYNENQKVVIKNLNDVPYTIYTEDFLYQFSADKSCLIFDTNNQLVRAVDSLHHSIDFFGSLEYYGGSQMDFTDKIVEIVADEKYLNIMQNYFPEATLEDVECFSYVLCSSGCGYIAYANSIYDTFEGQEEKFQKIFGFPMYSIRNEKIESNVNYLAFDLALYRHKDVPLEEIYGNVLEYRESISDQAKPDAENVELKKRFSGTSYDVYSTVFNQYLKEKNLGCFTANDVADLDSYKLHTQNDKKAVLVANGTNLYADNDGDGVFETLEYENVGSHGMSITRIDNDGNYIVSSWGRECKADLSHVSEVEGGFSVLWFVKLFTYDEDGNPIEISEVKE